MSTVAPTTRTFGPASRQTRALERTLRRSWLPLARSWRITPRGLRMLQLILDPRQRVPVLRGTTVEQTRIAGRPAEWVRAPRAEEGSGADQPVILYLHGGGYGFGSPRTHRNLVSRLSHVTGLPALSLDYRLPPEAILPAPLEDALGAYRALLEDGHDAARIVLVGDSAGGSLTLVLALQLAELELSLPAGLVLLSPWLDLTMSGASFTSNANLDPFIPPIALHRFARLAARDIGVSDWRASPLFAPEPLLERMPPTLIQVGSTEVLLDDAVRAAERLGEAGVETVLQIFDRQPHVVPLWIGTPEARTALREIARFVDELLVGEGAPRQPSADEVAEAADFGPH